MATADLFEILKKQGALFVVMAIVIWILFEQVKQEQHKTDRRIERLETEQMKCNTYIINELSFQVNKGTQAIERNTTELQQIKEILPKRR
jgi:uncharacterized coiled-coil protein SlyX